MESLYLFHKIQLGYLKVINVAKPWCNNSLFFLLFDFFFFCKSIQVCWCNLFRYELGFNTVCEFHTKASSLGTHKAYCFSVHISQCHGMMSILSFSLKNSLFLLMTKSYLLRDTHIYIFRSQELLSTRCKDWLRLLIRM